MRSAWALLLFVVQALSLPAIHHEVPNQLQTLTFALDGPEFDLLSNVEKFDKILKCSEYFTTMIQNAKKTNGNYNYNYNYYPIPIQPKTGKGKITRVDSFEATNQIILSKDQDDMSCELIWTSYQNLLSGDIYNEINNADDLVNWLTVLLSDDNGKQKAYKVMPANYGWNTIDSDAEEAMTNNMKSMKKLKDAAKSMGKRSAEAKDTTQVRKTRDDKGKARDYFVPSDWTDIFNFFNSESKFDGIAYDGAPLISFKKRDASDRLASDSLRRVARTGKSSPGQEDDKSKEKGKDDYNKEKGKGDSKSFSMQDLIQLFQYFKDESQNNMSGVNIGKRSITDMIEYIVNRKTRDLKLDNEKALSRKKRGGNFKIGTGNADVIKKEKRSPVFSSLGGYLGPALRKLFTSFGDITGDDTKVNVNSYLMTNEDMDPYWDKYAFSELKRSAMEPDMEDSIDSNEKGKWNSYQPKMVTSIVSHTRDPEGNVFYDEKTIRKDQDEMFLSQ